MSSSSLQLFRIHERTTSDRTSQRTKSLYQSNLKFKCKKETADDASLAENSEKLETNSSKSSQENETIQNTIQLITVYESISVTKSNEEAPHVTFKFVPFATNTRHVTTKRNMVLFVAAGNFSMQLSFAIMPMMCTKKTKDCIICNEKKGSREGHR